MSQDLESIIEQQKRVIASLLANSVATVARDHRLKTPPPLRKANQSYYSRNREHLLAEARRRYAEDAAKRQRIRDRQREYGREHREQIRSVGNQSHDCPCGQHYTQSNRSRHMNSKRHVAWANKA